MRTFFVTSSLLAVFAHPVEEQTNLLQTQKAMTQQKAMTEEEVDCFMAPERCKPETTTMAPTTLPPTTMAPTTLPPTTRAPTTLPPTTLAPTTLPPTTTTVTKPLRPDIGATPGTKTSGDPCSEDAPSWGVDVNSGIVKYKNLGGLGPSKPSMKPWYAPEQSVVYEELGTYYGKKIDVIVTADDTYGPAQRKAGPAAMRWLNAVNGIQSGESVPTIGVEVQGTYTFNFTFVDSESKKKIPVPMDYSNNVVFFDLDGEEDGFEQISTCDASNTYTYGHSTGVRTSCAKSPICGGQARCVAKNMIEEVESDGLIFEAMTRDQRAASVTFSMVGENAGEFQVTYTTGTKHRIFIFKGTNDMICAPKAPTTAPPASILGKLPIFGKLPTFGKVR